MQKIRRLAYYIKILTTYNLTRVLHETSCSLFKINENFNKTYILMLFTFFGVNILIRASKPSKYKEKNYYLWVSFVFFLNMSAGGWGWDE
jgi:hypothetical protein